ncbi:MAG: hypothetical protein KAG99_03580, partial [Bacteroidales bacterium]|nr:hypothetical protein [Bacteroidales bacterium]
MKNIRNITKIVFVLIVMVSCTASLKTIEDTQNKYQLTTTEDLANDAYSKKIDVFYTTGKEGHFVGKEDIKIYYKIFKQKSNEKAAIAISSGRTEAAIKYK